jgi:hypothetical protein
MFACLIEFKFAGLIQIDRCYFFLVDFNFVRTFLHLTLLCFSHKLLRQALRMELSRHLCWLGRVEMKLQGQAAFLLDVNGMLV